MTADPLVAFIEARLAEDETVAFACIRGMERLAFQKRGALPPRWLAEDGTSDIRSEDGILRVRHTWVAERGHIVRHDPARVLCEVAAKRAVLKRWRELDEHRGRSAEDEARAWLGDEILGSLAAAYADHPDYDSSWAPERTTP